MAFGIRDIARLAGTSTATVSRILNNPDYNCPNELRSKVLRIVAENHYSPNRNARALRTGSELSIPQKRISCFIARSTLSTLSQDYFFSSFLRFVEQEAISNGCLLGFTYGSNNSAQLFTDDSNKEDTGLIVLGRPSNPGLIQTIVDAYPHVIFTGLQRISDPICQVISDGQTAAATALEYLHSLGHRRIAYVGETERENRYISYRTFLESQNLPILQDLIFSCSLGYEGGYECAPQILTAPSKPTAVFCANDLTAVGLISGLSSLGVHVPGDISVISIDNTELAEITTPLLTTVSIPIRELAHFSVDLALKKINHTIQSDMTINLPCKLIIRESCKRIE